MGRLRSTRPPVAKAARLLRRSAEPPLAAGVRDEFAALVVRRGLTVAVAESMTGGALAYALVAIPGSGDWFKGAVVAYDSAIKHDVLGVSPGPVISAPAAIEMANGVAQLLHADVGIATTGCAGPESMEGQPVGTFWIGIAIGEHRASAHHRLDGSPDEVRRSAVPIAIGTATCSLVDAWVARNNEGA